MNARSVSRVLWGISLPLMFAQVSEIVLHVTNTIFLARVGAVELGAIGLADSIWEVFLVVPLGLVNGIQILTARFLGRRRPRTAGAVLNQGLALVLMVSTALAALLGAGIPWISRSLVHSVPVGRAVDSFLVVACYGMPFTAANFVYSALLTSLGRTRVLVPATILLAVTNCTLDYVLIFGKLGLPAMGIRGAGWASVVSEIATFVFLTAYLVSVRETRRLRLFRWGNWRRWRFRRLVRISGPVSAQGMLEALRWFVFFIILERVGAATLAVANVVYACYEVLLVPTVAFAEAACSIVSRLIGRRQTGQIEPVIRRSTRAAVLATLPMIALGLLFPDWVLSIFTLDGTLLEAGMASLRIVALAMLVIIPAEMWLTAVVGAGDTLAALGIEFILTVVMLTATYVAALLLSGGGELAWWSLVAASLVTLVASYGWMRSGLWRRVAM